MSNPPRIHTVPDHFDFFDSVARGVVERCTDDPLALSDYTVLVPDWNAANDLRAAFLRQARGDVTILPKIEAVGDIDPDTLSLRIADDHVLSEALLDMPPAVGRLERQLVLAGEILKREGVASSVEKALKLGGELGRLLDTAQRNDIDLNDIDALVPETYRQQWSKTADFLSILTREWPAYLEKTGRVDPEDYRSAVLRVCAAHWEKHPTGKPVIAAGFSEVPPALSSLLQAVAKMPQGEIVLQGFDAQTGPKSWAALTPIHPQYAFKQLLKKLGADKDDVQAWSASVYKTERARAVHPERAADARQKLLRETMRPAATAEGWNTLTLDPQALAGMDMITCGTPQEEASVIAIKLRETLEVKGRTAVLVTPDRALARRVSARLKHWHIDVPDGAGHALSDTPAGLFLHATARMASENWAPVPFLAALKHPLAALGETPEEFKRKLLSVEDRALHGPRPLGGAQGLRDSLTAAFNRAAYKNRTPELAAEAKALDKFVTRLEKGRKRFFKQMAASKPQPFAKFLDAHIKFCEALAADDKTAGAQRLWRGDDGVKAARFLSQLRGVAHAMPAMTGTDYAAVLQSLMRDVNVPAHAASHPQLRILTPEQAARTHADVMIIGGLNDQVWPQKPDDNPWLSPEMMAALDMPGPETAVGRSARLFMQAASSPNVLLTRATRTGDAPAVSSPFLTRLLMVMKTAGIGEGFESKTQLLDIHVAMHTPTSVRPSLPPAPKPPKALRPKELPVTAIESLMRDPYTVYAKYVLKLRPKPAIDASPSVADRGVFTHAALEKFIQAYPDQLPEDPYNELLKIGREAFKTQLDDPMVQSFWWPRFERVAKWFVRFEAERREMTRTLGTEVRGKLEIDLGDSVFTLTTIADRVDINAQDSLEIVDYKTGGVPSQKSVALGFSPQLTLEALIAFTGGFKQIDAGDVGELQYWKLSGGRPAGEVTAVKGDVRQLVDDARDGVTRLMKAFNDPKTPYLSLPRPEWAPRYNNYKHLARVDEWSTVKRTEETAPAKSKPRAAANANGKTPKPAAPRRKKS